MFSIYMIDWYTKPPIDQSVKNIFTLNGRPVYGGVFLPYMVDQSTDVDFSYVQ